MWWMIDGSGVSSIECNKSEREEKERENESEPAKRTRKRDENKQSRWTRLPGTTWMEWMNECTTAVFFVFALNERGLSDERSSFFSSLSLFFLSSSSSSRLPPLPSSHSSLLPLFNDPPFNELLLYDLAFEHPSLLLKRPACSSYIALQHFPLKERIIHALFLIPNTQIPSPSPHLHPHHIHRTYPVPDPVSHTAPSIRSSLVCLR